MDLLKLKQEQEQVYLMAYLRKATEIKRKLEAKGWSARHLAKVAGVGQKTVSRLISGELGSLVSPETIKIIEEALR